MHRKNIMERLLYISLLLILSLRLFDAQPQTSVNHNIFQCEDGSFIPVVSFCDGIKDCDDGSDEINTIFSCLRCKTDEIGCHLSLRKRTCTIRKSYLCNGVVKCHNATPCDVNCPSYYRCENNNCVERTTLCNGDEWDGCQEDDNWSSGAGFKCIRQGSVCRLPQQLLQDEVQDCDQGDDLCFTFFSNSDEIRFNRSRCYKCLDGSMIIPRHKVCDGVIDCSDLSDECLCEEEVIPEICRHVKTRIPQTNQNKITAASDDEENPCKLGEVYCGNGTCINRTSVCDTIADCSDNRDERYSYCGDTLKCKDGLLQDAGAECRCDTSGYSVAGTLCDGVGDCPPPGSSSRLITYWGDPPGAPDDECSARCPSGQGFTCGSRFWAGKSAVAPSVIICSKTVEIFPFLSLPPQLIPLQPNSSANFTPITLPSPRSTITPLPPTPTSYIETIELDGDASCNGTVECEERQEDETGCRNRFYCDAGNRVNIPSSSVCDGIVDCNEGEDEFGQDCPGRFYCPSLNNSLVSIQNDSICDFIINCDDSSDELNCTKDGRFYCENGVPLFVNKRQIFDGRGDCSDMSDECPTDEKVKNTDSFSSRYELIASPVLRVLVWIMGLTSIIGNAAVIIFEGCNFRKKDSVLSRANHLLVLNLAVADFLMGLYLILLGIAGAIYSGVYCINKWDWLSSTPCATMGILVVLSSETSVITLGMMTTLRLCAVLKPFSTSTKPTQGQVLIGISFAWIFSILLAFIPLAPNLDYLYTDVAWVEDNPYFQNATVKFSSAQRWIEKLFTFDPNYTDLPDQATDDVRRATSWGKLQTFVQKQNSKQTLEISRYYGYYSADSVCIPRLFVSRNDNSFGFSLSITIFNFLAFTYVACAYSLVVWVSRKKLMKTENSGRRKATSKDKSKHLQNKVLRLVVTDFFCWVPISIMAFINFSGIPVSNVAYAVSAIILLPINSALNPILYSNFIDNIIDKTRSRLQNSSQDTSNADVVVARSSRETRI
ncbi:uncharacterized protein LOC143460429 [Clavelina lepadiformis]|uniref:uncharacterized protein LOC143460429 n=1 Tax=Clavelina lepadiformis TaxID=159417 RepID=UPI0040434D58